MRHLFLVLSFGSLAMACGGGGHGTPEDLAKATVAAMMTGDAEKMKALLPPDELIGKAMTCKDAASGYPERIKKMRAEVDKDAAKMKEKVKDITAEYVGLEDKETTAVEKGKDLDGCTANEAFEVKKVKIKMKLTMAGKTEDEDEGGKFIKLDGKWYLLDL